MNYKTLIIGAAATLVGGAAGFITGKIIYQKKYDNDVAEMRAYYNSRLESKNKISPRVDDVNLASRNPSAVVTEEGYTKYHRDIISTSDSETAAEEPSEDLSDEEDAELEAEEIKQKVDRIIEGSKIEIISEEEIGDFTGFGMRYLTYYEKDGVVADDNDEVVLGYEEILGNRAIPELLTSKYDDVIYVANRSYMTIYEVTVHPGKYADVMGFTEESDE